MFSEVLCWVECFLVGAAIVSILSYTVLFVLDAFIYEEQNLKLKYGADWAVVTGSSSGIGKSIAYKLARQGINVVFVALDNELLHQTFAQIQQDFPALQFRKVPLNLGKREGLIEQVHQQTSDILPRLIFNNAGYIQTGLFAFTALDSILQNYDCNATSAVLITHHFVSRILQHHGAHSTPLRGAVFFTSSGAGVIPSPTASMYGSTKAFLTEFGASIAPELKPLGLDVLVMRPSPVNTNFYTGNKHNLDALNIFRSTATSPDTIASYMFKGIGRSVVCDQGYFSLATALALRVIDYNLLAIITTRFAKVIFKKDFEKMSKKE